MSRAPLLAAAAVMLLATGVAGAGPQTRAPAPPAAPATAAPATATRDSDAPLRPAAADNRRIVGILELRVEGVPDEVKETFQHRLEEQLDTKHYWLASRARMKQMMQRSTTWTEGCIVGPCIMETRRYTGAELVLLASLTGAGTSFGYVVTLVRTDTGRILQQRTEHCEICTVNEALDKATLATIALLNNVPDKLPDEAADRAATQGLAIDRIQQRLVAQDRHTAQVGMALTVVGLAATVGGLLLYQLDGRPTYAVATATGGGALALGGLTILTF